MITTTANTTNMSNTMKMPRLIGMKQRLLCRIILNVLAVLAEVEHLDPEAADELRHEIAENFYHYEELFDEDLRPFSMRKPHLFKKFVCIF